jgi:hypothetical protein
MLKDTFEKVTRYRNNVTDMLRIISALHYRITKFTDNSLSTKPIIMPPYIYSKRLKIQTDGNAYIFYRASKEILMPRDIEQLSRDGYASIDQVFDVLTHLDEEMTQLFAQIVEIYSQHASIVIEEFKDSALPDLM